MPFRSSALNNKSLTGARTRAVFAAITGDDPLARAAIADFTPRVYTMRSVGLGGEAADQNSEELPQGRGAQRPQAGVISFQGAMVAEVPLFGWADIYQGLMSDRSPDRSHAIRGTVSATVAATNMSETLTALSSAANFGAGRTGLAKCSRLVITIAGATDLTSVTIRLTGTTFLGRVKSKTYKIALASGAGTFTTSDFWATVTAHQVIAKLPTAQAIAGTLAIAAADGGSGTTDTTLANASANPADLHPVEIVYTPGDATDPLPYYGYFEEGGIPKTARGVYMQGLNFNAVKNTLPAVNLDMIALRVNEYQNVAGGAADFSSGKTTLNDGANDFIGVSNNKMTGINVRVLAKYGSDAEIVIPADSVNFNLSNNHALDETLDLDPYNDSLLPGIRTLSAELSVRRDRVDDDLLGDYLSGRSFESTVEFIREDSNDFPNIVRYSLKNAGIGYPTSGVEGPGRLNRNVTISGYTSGATESDDIEITSVSAYEFETLS